MDYVKVLKSLLPFVDRQQQMPLAVMIQVIEFQNTIKLFQSQGDILSTSAVHSPSDRRSAMIQALMNNLSEEEQASINNMMNMINMMNMMENYEDII